MPIQDQIRAALIAAENAGRTLADIAAASGVHVVNVSRFKGGKSGLSVENLEALANALGLTIVAQATAKKIGKKEA